MKMTNFFKKLKNHKKIFSKNNNKKMKNNNKYKKSNKSFYIKLLHIWFHQNQRHMLILEFPKIIIRYENVIIKMKTFIKSKVQMNKIQINFWKDIYKSKIEIIVNIIELF